MRISDKIKSHQTKLNGLRDELTTLKSAFEADSNNVETLTDMESVMADIEVNEKALNILSKSEQMDSTKAVATIPNSNIDVKMEEKDYTDFMVKSALVTLESFALGISVSESIEKRYGTDKFMKGASQFVTKGAQDPAFTNVPTWAEELVQNGFSAFMDLIAVDSVVGQLPLTRYSFDGYGSLTIPTRTKRYPADKNLAGAWTKEGDPIRIGAATFGSTKLSPKKLGVIGTFTRELFERSTPNIEVLIRKFMLEDTSIAIDTLFISATAGVADKSPAGILVGVTPITSGGSTPDKLAADMSKAISDMMAAGGGSRPVWIMNPARKAQLRFLQNSVGTSAFPELASGVLLDHQIATSLTVPLAEIILVDADAIGIAGGLPKFLASNTATLHEEYVAADVKPIVDGAGTPVTASPVRSLYQTDSLSLRMTIDMDWAVLRDPAASAQIINAIA